MSPSLPTRLAAALAAATLASATLPAAAQTIYKLIDKNGKVTYAEKPPKDFDGQVIPMTIDPKANIATFPKAAPAKGEGAKPTLEEARVKREGAEERVKNARERLEAARKELADARENPREGEITWLGKVGGGARPVPTEAYEARLKALEENVKAAEEEVDRAEREAR